MGDKSAIHWTDATWNPLVGCSRVSEGCRNCYDEREAATRLAQTPKYRGLARKVNGQPSWTGEVRLWEPHLDQPLRWQAPRRIFVNSMSDLFHEKVPDEWIGRIFSVMKRAHQHTFQVLTKRPERMREWLNGCADGGGLGWITHNGAEPKGYRGDGIIVGVRDSWPLPNVWLGVSIEDQETADERIPLLLQTPAAVRFISYEPALGPISLLNTDGDGPRGGIRGALHWGIYGGESGPGARPNDVAWARRFVADCRVCGIAPFVKQLGTQPRGICSWPHHDEQPPVWLDEDGVLPAVSGKPPHDLWHTVGDSFGPCRFNLRDRKGGDPQEWPEDLRVREYPR